MNQITILIPAYNEEEVLYTLYERLLAVFESLPRFEFEVLLVNDGSTDNTLGIIKALRKNDPRISFVDLTRNFGKEIAMMAGFDYAKGDAVIIIDADLQDPPELIPEMIKYWQDGFEDVYAKRRTRAGETWLKKSTSSLFTAYFKKYQVFLFNRIPEIFGC